LTPQKSQFDEFEKGKNRERTKDQQSIQHNLKQSWLGTCTDDINNPIDEIAERINERSERLSGK